MKIGRQRLINEFFKSSGATLNLIPENLRLKCVALCKKCSIETTADLETEKCRICYSTLEYRCTLCGLQFFSSASIKNHVTKSLEQIPTSEKCSKCYRSHFLTYCSLYKHERNCSSTFYLDKEIFVKLDRCDNQLLIKGTIFTFFII